MKPNNLLTILALTALFNSSAFAVEGAIGRPVSGTLINPFAGVVPPAPGFSVSVGEIYYDADIGGGGTVPLGVNLALDLDTEISFTNLNLTYIWDTPPGRWNFASAVALPLASVDVEATVTVGPKTGSVRQDEFGAFDLAFVPIFASYHISETEHLGMNLTVWAPTGGLRRIAARKPKPQQLDLHSHRRLHQALPGTGLGIQRGMGHAVLHREQRH